MRSTLFCAVLLALTIVFANADLQNVVESVSSLQSQDGGFRISSSGDVSLDATAHSLLLSSLYSITDINTDSIPGYLNSVANSDSGYANQPGEPSTVEATLNAVLAYRSLGQPVPNADKVSEFIRSQYNSNDRLVANSATEAGSIKATALALKALELLSESEISAGATTELKAMLASHAKSNHYEFAESNLSAASANYYGIVVGSSVGVPYNSEWADYIVALQSDSGYNAGGFYEDESSNAVSIASTVHSVFALNVLGEGLNKVNYEALKNFLHRAPSHVRDAALCQSSLVLVNAADNFDVDISYSSSVSSPKVQNNHAVEGSSVKPVVHISANRVNHNGFSVSASFKFGNAVTEHKEKLQYEESPQHYTFDEYVKLGDYLGVVSFSYAFSLNVPGVGEVSFTKTDELEVGYGIVVQAEAVHDVTGREINEGETVSLNTNFNFAVTLRNHEQDSFVSGDFKMEFDVLDSSDVAVESEFVDGRTNKKPITFSYSIKNANLPAGDLSFKFQVSTGGRVHTTHRVTYRISSPMIASAIVFEGIKSNAAPEYKLGSKASVSMEPATFQSSTVHNLAGLGLGKDIAAERKFFLDASTPAGTLLRSIPGKVQKGNYAHPRYQFPLDIDNTLDSVGTTVVSFRYVTASGESVSLANYDSKFGELLDETSQLNYTVATDLQVVDVKNAPSGKFTYGKDISMGFKVKDAATNTFVAQGEKTKVYLQLSHKDSTKSRSFTSAEKAADFKDGKYEINWQVSSNAIKGKGSLSLVVKQTDAEQIPLATKNGKPLSFDIEIGGEIAIATESFSTNNAFDESSIIIAEFGLSCDGRPLRDTRLSCNIHSNDEVLGALPVAADKNGGYSVSYVANSLPSGTYKFKFYRDADTVQTAEQDAWREKQHNKEVRDRELRGESTEGLEFTKTELEPLFEITVEHKAVHRSSLPIKTQWLAMLFLSVGFYIMITKRQEYSVNSK